MLMALTSMIKATSLSLALLGGVNAGDQAIRWSAHPDFVLDVSGFDYNAKDMQLWDRPYSGDLNDNEIFYVESLASEGSTADRIRWATQKSSGQWCLTADGIDNGAKLFMSTCGDSPQEFEIQATAYGTKMVLKDTSKCVSVTDLTAKNAQTLQLWDCNNDRQQSFDIDGYHPSPAPTPSPPSPTPAPPSPTPTPPAPTPTDDDLINEFNDPNMGVGFTIIPLNVWELKGEGNNGMDAAGFYNFSMLSEYHGHHQQAVSVVTRVQDMNPYDGGYGTYGLAFHLTEQKQFWKYFQSQGNNKDELCAKPGDGWACAPNADARIALYKSGQSYDWFTQKKNAILAKYNTVYKIHDYNEFDTNGLSPDGLAGVFVNEQWHKPGPNSTTMCAFLMHANPSKTSWPVYGYTWKKMYIKEVLNCVGHGPTAAQIVLV